ncbi:MAG: iron-containing alcohol dehydrogenase family protein [Thermogutta sp.]
MLRTWTFRLPTIIRFGRGSARKLGELAQDFGWKALLVGYKDASGMEAVYHKVQQALRSARVHADTFFEVGPEPDQSLVTAGAEAYKKSRSDLIVAVGGGSVIDVAKGIGALVKLSGEPWDFTNANESHRRITESAPVIAVPTTAGTGSEVTSIAVFHNPPEGTGWDVPAKAAMVGEGLHPKVAVIDPDLLANSPPDILAACAADALIQAMEACLSRMCNPISTVLGGQAARLIFDHMPRAMADPTDMDARSALALAATMSGAAYDVTGLTVGHALAHALGAIFDVPHGRAVAMAGPVAIRFMAGTANDCLKELAYFCERGESIDEHAVEMLLDRLSAMFREAGLPEKFTPPPAPPNYLDLLVQHALRATPEACKLTPVPVDAEVLRNLFTQILA